MHPAGALVLIGTPIGNLRDLSPRAADELVKADVVACEDTRRTGKLLQLSGLRVERLMTVNDHNEAARIPELVERIRGGERVALVSDAGMPGISDPGERVSAAVAEAGLTIEVIPGPSAAVTALVGSGLPTGRFVFEGFLPRKGAARGERLASLALEPRTIVFYEAPHRVGRTMVDLAEVFGADRRVAIGRELTKMHEEFWRGSLADAIEWASEPPKGELVIVVDGAAPAEPATDDDLTRELTELIVAGSSRKDAVAELTRRHQVPRRRVYNLALEIASPEEEGR